MRNPDNFGLIGPLSRSVDQAVISSRFEHRGVHLDDCKTILKGTDLKLLKVSEAGESVEKGQGIAIAIALVVLLYTVAADVRNHHHAFGDRGKNHAHHGSADLLRAALRAARRKNPRRGGCGLHPVRHLDDFHRAAFFLRRAGILGPDAQFPVSPEFTFLFRWCSTPASFSSAAISCTLPCSPRSAPPAPTNRTPSNCSGWPWRRWFSA